MTPQRFHTLLLVYLDEYRAHLSVVKSNVQATSNCSIIKEFVGFLHNPNLVSGLEQITVSIACSKFMAHYLKRNRKVVSKEEMKKILRGYFEFIDGKYGMRNGILMRGLGK